MHKEISSTSKMFYFMVPPVVIFITKSHDRETWDEIKDRTDAYDFRFWSTNQILSLPFWPEYLVLPVETICRFAWIALLAFVAYPWVHSTCTFSCALWQCSIVLHVLLGWVTKMSHQYESYADWLIERRGNFLSVCTISFISVTKKMVTSQIDALPIGDTVLFRYIARVRCDNLRDTSYSTYIQLLKLILWVIYMTHFYKNGISLYLFIHFE